eukprot:IDg10216t1
MPSGTRLSEAEKSVVEASKKAKANRKLTDLTTRAILREASKHGQEPERSLTQRCLRRLQA